jgi:DNA-binding transcriptional ArsR family regulator
MSKRGVKKSPAIEREETDCKMLAAFEKSSEPLSEAQLVQLTGLWQSTVQNSLTRLRNHGFVRKCKERRRVGKFGNLACVYELGDESEAPWKRESVAFTPFRDPLTAALFGDYVPAKNAPATRAEAA